MWVLRWNAVALGYDHLLLARTKWVGRTVARACLVQSSVWSWRRGAVVEADGTAWLATVFQSRVLKLMSELATL